MNRAEFTPAATALVRLVVELSRVVTLLVDEAEARYARWGDDAGGDAELADQLARVKGMRYHLDDVHAESNRLASFVKARREAGP